jgi:hypothetical protein
LTSRVIVSADIMFELVTAITITNRSDAAGDVAFQLVDGVVPERKPVPVVADQESVAATRMALPVERRWAYWAADDSEELDPIAVTFTCTAIAAVSQFVRFGTLGGVEKCGPAVV